MNYSLDQLIPLEGRRKVFEQLARKRPIRVALALERDKDGTIKFEVQPAKEHYSCKGLTDL